MNNVLLILFAIFSVYCKQNSKSEIPFVNNCSVYSLNDDNFDFYTSEGIWIIKFYAPWCGHCKHFAEPYKSISKQICSFAFAGEVNGDEQTDLKVKFNIQGFPTIIAIKEGYYYRFEQRRNEDTIIHWIEDEEFLKTPGIPVIRGKINFFFKLKSNFYMALDSLDPMLDLILEKIGFKNVSHTVKYSIILSFISLPVLLTIILVVLSIILCKVQPNQQKKIHHELNKKETKDISQEEKSESIKENNKDEVHQKVD